MAKIEDKPKIRNLPPTLPGLIPEELSPVEKLRKELKGNNPGRCLPILLAGTKATAEGFRVLAGIYYLNKVGLPATVSSVASSISSTSDNVTKSINDRTSLVKKLVSKSGTNGSFLLTPLPLLVELGSAGCFKDCLSTINLPSNLMELAKYIEPKAKDGEKSECSPGKKKAVTNLAQEAITGESTLEVVLDDKISTLISTLYSDLEEKTCFQGALRKPLGRFILANRLSSEGTGSDPQLALAHQSLQTIFSNSRTKDFASFSWLTLLSSLAEEKQLVAENISNRFLPIELRDRYRKVFVTLSKLEEELNAR